MFHTGQCETFILLSFGQLHHKSYAGGPSHHGEDNYPADNGPQYSLPGFLFHIIILSN